MLLQEPGRRSQHYGRGTPPGAVFQLNVNLMAERRSSGLSAVPKGRIKRMKLPTRILLTSAIFLVLIGVSVADSHISTEVIQPSKVERVATSLNHVTIIQLP